MLLKDQVAERKIGRELHESPYPLMSDGHGRVTPMAPTLVREPLHRAGWVYEEKVDELAHPRLQGR